jgi:multiple sugar transport system ATP-binding protein
MAKIKLEGLRKVFDDGTVALKGATIEVEDGEFLVIVGPSGCGKTTTLRLIAGLEQATAGKIFIGEKLVNNLEPKDRNIAMIFQNYALYPHMTVYDNMAFGLKMSKVPSDEIEKIVKETALMLGIESLLHRKPAELSAGQKQRTAMGRAISRNPDVFLMDEPMSNLDAKIRVDMRAYLKKLQRELGVTTVYVTHDQEEAMTMADRIVVMRDGEISQVDPPNALYHHPVDVETASFIGSPAINIFECTLLQKDDNCVLEGPFTCKIPEHFLDLLNNNASSNLLFGVRPEDIYIDENGSIEGVVDLIEPLGPRTQVRLIIGNSQITIIQPSMTELKVGDEVKITFDNERMHFFDLETHKRLAP